MQWGHTALIHASIKGHTNVVKYLVENKANVDAKTKVSMLCVKA